MSRPPSSAEQLAARRQAAPALPQQLMILLLGMLSAATIGGILGSVTEQSHPIWVLPVIGAGTICFFALLATAAWSMRSVTGQLARPFVTSGGYLACVLLAGAAATYAAETPPLAYGIPLVLACFFAAMTWWGRMHRRSKADRSERLRSGAHAMGTVTDDGLAVFEATPNQKVATLTVSFPDFAGHTRWVTVMALQTPGSLIAAGQKVDVWFDASDPGNVTKIVVAHDNGASRIIGGKVKLFAATPGAVDPQHH